MSKSNTVLYQDFINFVDSKGALFLVRKEKKDFHGKRIPEIDKIIKKGNKDNKYYYKQVSYYDVINFKGIKEKTNLFFTVCGFEKNRKAKNVKSINCFFFDLDIKDPENKKIKCNLESIVDEIKSSFDIVTKTRGGRHFFDFIPDGKYNINDTEKYINDWKQRGKELEATFSIKLDHSIYDISRIARIPLSYHRKEEKSGKLIEIIKGEEFISPLHTKKKLINEIEIIEVVKALISEKLLSGVEVVGNEIYRVSSESGKLEKSDGLKINDNFNYIKDFSYTEREKSTSEYLKHLTHELTGKPFSLVQNIYKNILLNSGVEEEKAIGISCGKTYLFFKKYFGIESNENFKKNIIIPKGLEKELYKAKLNALELKYFLGLINYSQGNNKKIDYLGKENVVNLDDFNNYNGFDKNITKAKKYLNTLFNNKVINEKYEILKGSIEGNKIIYQIIPNYRKIDKKIRNTNYKNHYINKKILAIKTNGNYLNLTFEIFYKLINNYNKTEINLKKDVLIKQLGDSNFSRVKQKLTKISKDLGKIFEVSIKGNNVIINKIIN